MGATIDFLLSALRDAAAKRLFRKDAACTIETLWHPIGHLLAAFSPAQCANYFTDAGYYLPIRATL
jgi:hypothetical protein